MVRIQFALLVGTLAWDLPDKEHPEYDYYHDYYWSHNSDEHHEHHKHHGHKHDRREHRGPHPGREKFQPLVDACRGLDVNTSCSSTIMGTCKADEDDSKMYCAHERPGKPHKEHSSRPPWSKGSHGPKQEGNCGNKTAGDSCSVQKEGICVSSGKCPIFQGEVVCKAKDAHPPSFVTEPCNDKAEGDECQTWHGPGKCHKFFEDFVCKPDWEQSGHRAHRGPHKDHEHREHGEHPDYDYYHDYYGDHDRDEHEHHKPVGHKHDRYEHHERGEYREHGGHPGHRADHGPHEDHEHHEHRGHKRDHHGHSVHSEHGEHRGHEHDHERPSAQEARLRQPYRSAAFGSGGKSGAAPSSWMAERLQWLSGVPTWWSDDGNAHWTSVAV